MAKLQDTLEVFMEELEKVQNSIDSVKEINPIIDNSLIVLSPIMNVEDIKDKLDLS